MEQPRENVGTKKDLVHYRLEAARADLKSARILLEAGEYRGANNRAYYAILRAVNAVHALNGTAYKRHKDYVKAGIFPREMGRKISEAEEIRHASDYDDFYIASQEEAERQVTVANEFIEWVETYCANQFKLQV